MNLFDVLAVLGGGFGGVLLALLLFRARGFSEKQYMEREEEAKSRSVQEAETIRAQAKERVSERKKRFEVEHREFSEQLEKMEKMFETKAASVEKREAKINDMKRSLATEEQELSALRTQAKDAERDVRERLLRMTGLERDRIKDEVITSYAVAFQEDAELRLQRALEWAQECAIRDARTVLSGVMYRYADPSSGDSDEGTIHVARDEVKGRIVGRGGRLIAYFEELFQVDVIFNDEPNTIIVSCFNLVQREIARAGLIRLMREKNITEEVITRVKVEAERDVEKVLIKEGEAALKKIDLKNMPMDLAKLIGRLRFRTSYGQNVLRHSFEVGYFSRLLANEIGADPHVAFLGGFFHDIGKAIDQEVGGSHDVLSKEILEKYGFAPDIVHAAWVHHNAIPPETVEAKIVQAADAISAGRPGARAESLERYLEKITELQETALSFAGVKKAFAINAGRELRAMLDPDKVNDADAQGLASNIAAKVQEKGGYPGRIKIVTIRTTKATDYAK